MPVSPTSRAKNRCGVLVFLANHSFFLPSIDLIADLPLKEPKYILHRELGCLNPHPPTPHQHLERSHWGLGHILLEEASPDRQQMDANGIFIYRVKLNWSCILMHNLHNQLCSELMSHSQYHLGPFCHSCLKAAATENGD